MSPRAVGRTAAVDVVVIGGGHNGLAMSHALAQRSIEHCVLERGAVAHAWRTARWDSLRLLTPNWMCRLPGRRYAGDDPHGYLRAGELAAFLEAYAAQIAAPVLQRTTVRRVGARAGGYLVETDRGAWRCRAVVLATGAFAQPAVPALAAALPADVEQLDTLRYRHPGQLGPGGVLVVGASASGLQIAQEIHASGRPVTLAVGEHVRMPRLYRGRDVQWWLWATGLLDQRLEETDDPARARRLPSPQLVGTPERATLDLNTLQAQGVSIVGRLVGVRDGRALFSGSLRNVCALADLKMNRLLDRFDDWAARHGVAAAATEAPRGAPTAVPSPPRLALDLRREVCTVVWATGARPDFSFVDLPVFDARGGLVHDGGVVAAPGIYALGLPFMRRRKSSFIHGAEDDVRDLAAHLAGYLGQASTRHLQQMPAPVAAHLFHRQGLLT